MPANRQQRPRVEKIDELLAAAQRLFIERGFDGTAMSAVAKEAGVASNVVYWHFDSKDDLFVAALELLVDGVVREALAVARGNGDEPIDIEAGLITFV